MKKIDDANLKVSNEISYDNLKNGEGEEIKSRDLRTYFKFLNESIIIKENDVVLDIGANIGDVSYIFNKLKANVYAYEPTKKTYEVLKKRFEGCEKVHCYNLGVWNENKTMKFYHHEWSKYNEVHWSNGNSLLEEKGNVNKLDYEEVEVMDIAEIISLHSHINLIKIDVEGAEIELINRILDSNLMDKIDKIICEVHDEKYVFLREKTNKLRERIRKMNLKHKINLDWH